MKKELSLGSDRAKLFVMTPVGSLAPHAQVAAFSRKHRTGLVALLFTDIVGSTQLKQRLGDRQGIELIQRHHALIRQTLAAFPEAEEIETAGDSFFLVFVKPSEAVKFALLLQTQLQGLAQETGQPVHDRIGIHVGEVLIETGEGTDQPKGLYGLQVDTCARVMSLAGARQILMTRFAFDSARQVLRGDEAGVSGELRWLNHGLYVLKGVEEPLEICEVRLGDGGPITAPGDTEKAHRYLAATQEPVLGWRPAVGELVPETHWVLEAKLGEGGFGEVWLVRHRKLKEQRVFKFCFRADRVRALKREMTLFRVLKERVGDHPHIVRLLEVNLDKPPYFLEEEYLAGRDLRTWCQGQGGIDQVPLGVRLEIVAQAAEGLAAAHEAGVIHRDVKPGNILICDLRFAICDLKKASASGALSSGQGASRQAGATEAPTSSQIANQKSQILVKLTDFGIGQVVSAEFLAGITVTGLTGTIVAEGSSSGSGSQMYMAPELLAGRPASVRSDLYSLGVVLYQLVVGDFARPVTTEWADDVSDPIVREDIKRCLTIKREEQFPNASELAKSLRTLEQRRAERAVGAKMAFDGGTARVASLAVLPFVNMSPDPENEYLSDGIAEDLITALSRVAGLRVPGRTSCFAFKGKTQDLRKIGQMLSVATVLEGSVRKAGQRLRITAQLINVADGFHLWSERYDREMIDVFAIQDEIAQAIVAALMPKLAAERPALLVKPYTGNVEAYELCLRGRYHRQRYTPDGFAMAIRLFEQAIGRDPNNPLAHAELANVYLYVGFLGGLPPRQGMPKAKTAALRAIELDDTLAAGHTWLGAVLFLYDWDWPAAEKEYLRALVLDPKNEQVHTYYALTCWAMLRYDQALAEFRKALELDPFSLDANWFLAWPLVCLEKYEEALEQATKLLAMDPNFWGGYQLSSPVKWRLGRQPEALQDAEKAAALERGPGTLAALCWFYGRAGRSSQARQTLEQLQQMAQSRYVNPVWSAWAHDGVGEQESAVAWLQRALEERDPVLRHLRGHRQIYPGLLPYCDPVLEQAGL